MVVSKPALKAGRIRRLKLKPLRMEVTLQAGEELALKHVFSTPPPPPPTPVNKVDGVQAKGPRQTEVEDARHSTNHAARNRSRVRMFHCST